VSRRDTPRCLSSSMLGVTGRRLGAAVFLPLLYFLCVGTGGKLPSSGRRRSPAGTFLPGGAVPSPRRQGPQGPPWLTFPASTMISCSSIQITAWQWSEPAHQLLHVGRCPRETPPPMAPQFYFFSGDLFSVLSLNSSTTMLIEAAQVLVNISTNIVTHWRPVWSFFWIPALLVWARG
jgi:hypothetical protein